VNDRSRGFWLLRWEMIYRFDSTPLREGCVDPMNKGNGGLILTRRWMDFWPFGKGLDLFGNCPPCQ